MNLFPKSLILALAAVLALPACATPLSAPPAPAGTVEYNTWLGQTFSEVLLNERSAEKRQAILDRIVAEDYIQHNPLVGEGRKGLADFLPYIYQSMPDAQFILHDVFATEDRVVTRWTWKGTLTGPGFLGVEPKGQALEFDVIDVWTVRDGQLYEHWDQFDWPRVFVQIGVEGLPQPFYDAAALPVDR